MVEVGKRLSEQIKCTVLASPKQPEMYLYLAEGAQFDDLPEPLRQRFGRPRAVMDLVLHPGRPLARVDVVEVMALLASQGFYLQMPPRIEVVLNEAEA